MRTAVHRLIFPLLCLSALLPGAVRAESTALAGGSGGYWYTRQCPAGEFLVGFGGRVGSYVDMVLPFCAAVAGNVWQGSHQVPQVGDFGRIPTVAPQPMPEQLCQTDRLIDSITVTKNSVGAFVSAIRAGCRRIDGRAGRVGGPSLVGGGPQMHERRLDCPAGQYARGISGRSGEFVDSIRLDCAPLTGPYAEDTVHEAGGAGGEPAQAMCPVDQRMVGLISRVERGPFGIWIKGLRPACAVMPTWDDRLLPTLLQTGQVGSQMRLSANVGAPDGDADRLFCPAGQYVAGVETHYERFVHSVRLRCRTMTYSAESPTRASGRNEGKRELLQCPGDMVAAGIVVRAGSAIDALRLRCKRDANPGHRLLALLGDSFGSGEGAPDMPVTGPPAPEDENPSERSLRAGWTYRPCHRSDRAGLVQAAKAIVRATNGDVAFRHFACSGAKVGDLRGDQQGSSETAAVVDPQLQTASEWARARNASIDTVLLSIGGNDAGFGARIADCAAAELIEDVTLGMLPGVCGDADFVARIDQGLRALEEALPDLQADLTSTVRPRQTYLVAYPDPVRNSQDFCRNFPDLGPRPGGGIAEVVLYNSVVGIDRDASRTIYTEFIVPLNELLAEYAADNGWGLLTRWDLATRNSGFCASERMFNLPSDTYVRQGNFHGVFHPNARGYDAQTPLIVEQLLPSMRGEIRLSGRPALGRNADLAEKKASNIDAAVPRPAVVQQSAPQSAPPRQGMNVKALQAAVDAYLAAQTKRNPRAPQRALWDPRAKPAYTVVRSGTQVDTDVVVGKRRTRMRFLLDARPRVTRAMQLKPSPSKVQR